MINSKGKTAIEYIGALERHAQALEAENQRLRDVADEFIHNEGKPASPEPARPVARKPVRMSQVWAARHAVRVSGQRRADYEAGIEDERQQADSDRTQWQASIEALEVENERLRTGLNDIDVSKMEGAEHGAWARKHARSIRGDGQ